MDYGIRIFEEFKKLFHKFNIIETITIILGFILFGILCYLLIFRRRLLFQKVKTLSGIIVSSISFLIIIVAFYLVKTKEEHDYKLVHRPSYFDKIVPYDSIFYLNFSFKNISDLAADIEDIQVYFILHKDSYSYGLDSLRKESHSIFPVDSLVIKVYSDTIDNLEIMKTEYLRLPLNLNYLLVYDTLNVITTCLSKKNIEPISTKTFIKWNYDSIWYEFELVNDSTFKTDFVQTYIPFTPLKTEILSNEESKNKEEESKTVKFIPQQHIKKRHIIEQGSSSRQKEHEFDISEDEPDIDEQNPTSSLENTMKSFQNETYEISEDEPNSFLEEDYNISEDEPQN